MEKHIKNLVDRKEYITKEEAYQAINEQYHETGLDGYQDGIELMNHIAKIPSADVVEVVRCRECVFWDTSWDPGVGTKGGAYYCPRCHLVTLKDSFCSGACRKDGGQDNGTA